MKSPKLGKAFTLIELLIVVAIIAILAAIAVPNFLEAQTRSKVSRTKADQRTFATGIESYAIDYNSYPPIIAPNSPFALTGGGSINGRSVFHPSVDGISTRFIRITTPIAYLTSVFRDPFIAASQEFSLGPTGNTRLADYDTYDYVDARTFGPQGKFGGGAGNPAWVGAALTSGASWRLSGCGPDQRQAFGGTPISGPRFSMDANLLGMDYDPTNGTVSAGDVVRIGGGPGPINQNGASIPYTDRVHNKINNM